MFKNKSTFIVILACILLLILLLIGFCTYSLKKGNSSDEEDKIPVDYVVQEETELGTEESVSNYFIVEVSDLPEVEPTVENDYEEQGNLIKELPEFQEYIEAALPAKFRDYIVLDSFTVFEDFVQYKYNVQYTAGTFICEQRHGEGLMFLEFNNFLDSEYPIIFFENGIPSNDEYIYRLCVENNVFGNYTTTYSEGDASIELYDSKSAELITVLQL